MDDLYRHLCTRPSDINEHLEYMHDLCVLRDATQVVELGVRTGVSTVAFLAAMDVTDGQVWSCDIAHPQVPESVANHPRWTCVVDDDLWMVNEAPECDVLFIDTSHDYQHTLDELRLYAPKVRDGGVILLHDTQLQHPDGVSGPDFPVRVAALEWHAANPGWVWTEFTHNHGLGVLTKEPQ